MGKLTGKRALVTSGGQGIGLAIANELCRRGCDVLVSYHSSADGASSFVETAKSIGRSAGAVKADLTDAKDADTLAEKAT